MIQSWPLAMGKERACCSMDNIFKRSSFLTSHNRLLWKFHLWGLVWRNSRESLSALWKPTRLVKTEGESSHQPSDVDVTAMHGALFSLSWKHRNFLPTFARHCSLQPQHHARARDQTPAPQHTSSSLAPPRAPLTSRSCCCNQQLPNRLLQSHRGGFHLHALTEGQSSVLGSQTFPSKAV